MIGYEQIVKRIELESGVSRGEIEQRIEKKLEQLGDLISREGAAHILAHELGIKVYDGLKKRLKIGELIAGITSVDVLGKVVAVYGVREFQKKHPATSIPGVTSGSTSGSYSGSIGKVGSFLLGDETGSVRVAVWDGGLLEHFSRLQVDGVIELQNAVVKERNGWKELHLGRGGGVKFDVAEDVVVKIGQQARERKKIGEVAEGDFVSVSGYIVQVFEPRFYEGCGECGRKIAEQGRCVEHGDAARKKLPVVNFYLDDGSGNIRVVAFRDVAEGLLLGLLAGGNFAELRDNVMGRYVCVEGKIVKNVMLGGKEMIASRVVDVEVGDVVGEILQ